VRNQEEAVPQQMLKSNNDHIIFLTSFSAIVESTTLFVGNLPFNIRERELEDIFAKNGKLRHVKVGFNPRTGTSYGYGFVEYMDRRDAEEAFKKYLQLVFCVNYFKGLMVMNFMVADCV
jgi:RNA recognition motif-containing protein